MVYVGCFIAHCCVCNGCLQGFPQHNIFINPDKTQLNFPVLLPNGRSLQPNVWKGRDGWESGYSSCGRAGQSVFDLLLYHIVMNSAFTVDDLCGKMLMLTVWGAIGAATAADAWVAECAASSCRAPGRHCYAAGLVPATHLVDYFSSKGVWGRPAHEAALPQKNCI